MKERAGDRFGRLVLLEYVQGWKKVHARWVCHCDCGKSTAVNVYRLRRGETQSCGCLATEQLNARNRKHGHVRWVDGHLRPSGAWRSWNAAKGRCTNPRNDHWKDYGGRGITMCARWREDFRAFLADMGPRPEGATLDRHPDNDGNYEPGNCRWATRTEQARNRRPARRN